MGTAELLSQICVEHKSTWIYFQGCASHACSFTFSTPYVNLLKSQSVCHGGPDLCPKLLAQHCRNMGLHDGMNSDGIMPNTKIAKAMGDVMGTSKKSDK